MLPFGQAQLWGPSAALTGPLLVTPEPGVAVATADMSGHDVVVMLPLITPEGGQAILQEESTSLRGGLGGSAVRQSADVQGRRPTCLVGSFMVWPLLTGAGRPLDLLLSCIPKGGWYWEEVEPWP